MAAKKAAPRKPVAAKAAAVKKKPAKPAAKPAESKAKKGKTSRPSVAKATRSRPASTGAVLTELKTLAKELNKAAQGLTPKKGVAANNPREVSTILGNVERMTSEAATKSLNEAESAQQILVKLLASLGKDWSRRDIENALTDISGHLTNIIVAQEFQDLAGQSLRKSIKALVGAIIVTEGGGPTEEGRLSQNEVDKLMSNLM